MRELGRFILKRTLKSHAKDMFPALRKEAYVRGSKKEDLEFATPETLLAQLSNREKKDLAKMCMLKEVTQEFLREHNHFNGLSLDLDEQGLLFNISNSGFTASIHRNFASVEYVPITIYEALLFLKEHKYSMGRFLKEFPSEKYCVDNHALQDLEKQISAIRRRGVGSEDVKRLPEIIRTDYKQTAASLVKRADLSKDNPLFDNIEIQQKALDDAGRFAQAAGVTMTDI